MALLVGFLLAIFLVSARKEAGGDRLRMRWLFVSVVLVGASMYSLRVIS